MSSPAISSFKNALNDLNSNVGTIKNTLHDLNSDVESIKKEMMVYKNIINNMPQNDTKLQVENNSIIKSLESRFDNLEKTQTTYNAQYDVLSAQYNTLNTNFSNMISTIDNVLKKIEDQNNDIRDNTNTLKLLKQQNNVASSSSDIVNDANDLTNAPNGTIACDTLNNIHLKVNNQIFTLKKNAVISQKNNITAN